MELSLSDGQDGRDAKSRSRSFGASSSAAPLLAVQRAPWADLAVEMAVPVAPAAPSFPDCTIRRISASSRRIGVDRHVRRQSPFHTFVGALVETRRASLLPGLTIFPIEHRDR